MVAKVPALQLQSTAKPLTDRFRLFAKALGSREWE
ncbi:hypothetical protein PSYPI_49072, partial [Pseudomonas syringae pv. pisi str. 1704B]